MRSLLSISFLILLLPVFNVSAITLDISGNVIAFPCEVDVDSVNKTVDLGTASVSGLTEPGSGHTWKSFDIKVVNCPESVNAITATFSGVPSGVAGDLYANTGDATNVAVQVAQRNNTALIQGNGSTMKVNVDSATHEALFPLVARMYSEQGNVQSGTLASVMELNFSYP